MFRLLFVVLSCRLVPLSAAPVLKPQLISAVYQQKTALLESTVRECTTCPGAASIQSADDCVQRYAACDPETDCCPNGFTCRSTDRFAAHSTCLPGGGSSIQGAGTLCGNGVCDSGESCATCARDCTTGSGKPCPRVGILYSGWHLPVVNGWRAAGTPFVSVETVLRSDGTLSLGQANTDTAFHAVWHSTPPEGEPYCIYHARSSGDLHYNPVHESSYLALKNVPDCRNYSAIAARHATSLVAAGVDFIVYDSTNLQQFDASSDALQLRPFQVRTDANINLCSTSH